MLAAKEGPKEAVSWYAKTQFIMFFSLLMFFTLFIVAFMLLSNFINSGIAAIISVILSLTLTFLYVIYYNKRHIKEWKENRGQNKLTSNVLPSIFIGLFILIAALTFIFESSLIKTAGRISMAIVFLLYVYFKFFKK